MSLSSAGPASYIARAVSFVLENVTRDTDATRRTSDTTRGTRASTCGARVSTFDACVTRHASRSAPTRCAFYSGNCETLGFCRRALSRVITRDIRTRARSRYYIQVCRVYLYINTYGLSRKSRPINLTISSPVLKLFRPLTR